MTATEKTARTGETLRALLARPTILDQPAICDPFSARLAADAGYEAVALGGYAIGAHLPLTSKLSLDDIQQAAAAVIRVCGLPVLLDADIDWGGVGDIAGALARLEAAGVAAVVVTGQHLTAHMPFSGAERGHALADLLCRVRAARTARTSLLVMVRCAVPADGSYDSTLRRAADVLDAGADAILLHAPSSQLPLFPRDLPSAMLIYAGSVGHGPEVTASQLQQWGYHGLSLQYHRCYCARRRPEARASPAALFSPCSSTDPALTGSREDLERKQ